MSSLPSHGPFAPIPSRLINSNKIRTVNGFNDCVYVNFIPGRMAAEECLSAWESRSHA